MYKTFGISTKYLDNEVYMELGRYHDGSLAVRLMLENGEPASVATVCLSHIGAKPGDGNVFIKDWSENEGMLDGLRKAGIVGETIQEIPTATRPRMRFLSSSVR